MCNLKFRQSEISKIRRHFGVSPNVPLSNIGPGYSIKPTNDTLIVRFDAELPGRTLEAVRWDLIPHYYKPVPGKRKHLMTNARSETLTEKGSFRPLLPANRCLVVADGFYEYEQELPDRDWKQPFAFVLKEREPIGFAGLWTDWKNPETQERVRSCTIVTTRANERLSRIHDRMPVILRPADYGRWLGEEGGDAPLEILQPYASDEMDEWPVSRDVNRRGVELTAAILEPIQLSGQQALF